MFSCSATPVLIIGRKHTLCFHKVACNSYHWLCKAMPAYPKAPPTCPVHKSSPFSRSFYLEAWSPDTGDGEHSDIAWKLPRGIWLPTVGSSMLGKTEASDLPKNTDQIQGRCGVQVQAHSLHLTLPAATQHSFYKRKSNKAERHIICPNLQTMYRAEPQIPNDPKFIVFMFLWVFFKCSMWFINGFKRFVVQLILFSCKFCSAPNFNQNASGRTRWYPCS